MSYVEQYVAANKENQLCLIAWAYSGDGDLGGSHVGPETSCVAPVKFLDKGLGLRIEGTETQPSAVLYLLPPALTEDAVRTELLKIPGNHEDLHPPVEFNASEDGLVSVAMDTATADELGEIILLRPDDSQFTLPATP